MERHVFIIQTNTDDALKATTRLFIVEKDGRGPDLTDAEEGRGQSIPEFFESWGISLQTMIELFPDCFETVEPYDGSSDWKTPLTKQTLPYAKPDFTRLATLLEITVFARAYHTSRGVIFADSARPKVTDWLFERKQHAAGPLGFVVFHMHGGNTFRVKVSHIAVLNRTFVSFFTDSSFTQANILRFDAMERIEVEKN